LNDYVEAVQLLQESLGIYNQIGDWRGMATSQGYLALLMMEKGEYHEAKQIYCKSIATWQEVGYLQGSAYALVDLGFFLHMAKEYTEARRCLQQALDTALDAQMVPTIM
jgi:tetratricopeptide (TPR) repeat protein